MKGKSPVLCLKGFGDRILTEKWDAERIKNKEDEERLHIIRTAASFIREDIRSKAFDLDKYPPADNFLKNSCEDIPQSLSIFLKELFAPQYRAHYQDTETKSVVISHAIRSIVRPRSFISTIQL